MEDRLSDLTARFTNLSPSGKARFLARIAHNETIHARAAYYSDPRNIDAMFRYNEFIHRLCGYIMAVSGKETSTDPVLMMEHIHSVISPRGDKALHDLILWLQREH